MQILLPLQLEQTMTAHSLHAAGVAGAFGEKTPLDPLKTAVQWAMHDLDLATKCNLVAQVVQQRGPFDVLSKLTSRCLELLSPGGGRGRV